MFGIIFRFKLLMWALEFTPLLRKRCGSNVDLSLVMCVRDIQYRRRAFQT